MGLYQGPGNSFVERDGLIMWSTFGFLPSVGPWELILILAIALIIFGPGKLPDVGRSLGKSIKEFKNASNEVQRQVEAEIKEINDAPKGDKA